MYLISKLPVRYSSIPEATFKKLHGINLESARLTPEYGVGRIGFMKVSHHLHCLNLLRMGVYKDYYMQEAHEPAIFRDRPWKIKLHFGTSNPHLQLSQPVSSSYFNPSRMQLADHFLALEHCIEMLRQKIMCNADVGIIPHHCIKQSPDPFVNLNRWHKCRDIGSVERWIEEHAIPEVEGEGSLPRPEGDRVWGEPLWR